MISVNNIKIDPADIATEMQYHPADNKRAAEVKAAESLVIGELFRQRADVLGITSEQEQALDLLIEQEVDMPQATEQECLRYFEANRDKFCSPTIMEARHILIAADPKDSDQRDEMAEIAEQVLKQVQQDPDCFTAMVHGHSGCPSKEQGGNLGQISKGQTVPEFEKALMAAEVGIVPFVIESRYGFHIAKLERKVAGTQLPFEVVQDKTRDFLNDRVKRKAIAQYIETLISDANIVGFNFNVAEEPLLQ
jgi:peptidyl-prolyl cis-trans isomerase C